MTLPSRPKLPLKVFLSVGTSTDTATPRRLLDQAVRQVIGWDELDVPSSLHNLPSVLAEVDALAAVIDRSDIAPSVLLEIGTALGRSLPVVLLVTRQELSKEIASPLRELPLVVLTDAHEAVAGRLAETLVSAVESARYPENSAVKHATAAYVHEVRERGWVDESERLVATALAQLGARVVGQGPGNEINQVDIAAWIPGLEGAYLNPVLVEVTGRRPNIEGKRLQLSRYLREGDSLLGILVIPDGDDLTWRIAERQAILIISLERLSGLSPDGFLRVLLDGRNKLFHAAS